MRRPAQASDERLINRLEDMAPLTGGGLAEQPVGRIPQAVIAIHHPPPIRHVLQHDSGRMPKRTREMSNRRVTGDYKVEIFDHSGGVQESIRAGIEVCAQRFHGHSSGHAIELLRRAFAG
jgi:hypothetical protein